MRKFESDYRIRESDDVLQKEDSIHRDLDLRVDAVEQIAEEFRAGNRQDVDALVGNIEKTFSKLAAEMRTLLDSTAGGISADVVIETAERLFFTEVRRAALLAELRGGVADKGDTLAKLLDLINGIDVAGPIAKAVSDLIGTAPADRRTLRLISDAVDVAKSQADAALSNANDAGSVAAAALPKAGGTLTGNLLISKEWAALGLVTGGNQWVLSFNKDNSKLEVNFNGINKLAVSSSNGDVSAPAYSGLLSSYIESRCGTYAAGRVDWASYTGAVILDKLYTGGNISVAQSPGTLVWRDANGRAYGTDALNRSAGVLVPTRDGAIGGLRWDRVGNGALGVLVDQTEVLFSANYSDERLKENIEDRLDADELGRIDRIAFKGFDWKPGAMSSGHVDLGLIAQDLMKISPAWVAIPSEEGGFYQLNVQGLLVSALRALQQTSSRLQAAEARLAALES